MLRRIVRRAVRHGHMLGAPAGFFHKLVPALVAQMGEAYPELAKLSEHVQKVLRLEEEQFAKTLDKGMAILGEEIAKLKGDTIPGELAFKLYDTYGFPLDLTADVARERNLKVDEAGFNAAMDKQREQARAAGNFAANYGKGLEIAGETAFLGYSQLENTGAVKALFKDGQTVQELKAGEQAVIVLDETAFYGESGGQCGDTGFLKAAGVVFQVQNTQKESGNHLHQGVLVEGKVKVGDKLSATVDAQKRQATAIHHSATHLLHAALRKVLGEHVTQKGSLVTYDKLRFDFSHLEGIKPAELAQIERLVNDQIRANTEVSTRLMNIDAARATGAMALFGEKYDDEVRVLSMGVDNFSVELCGGTHAKRTGDIGLLKVVSESGIAAGIRRIEAVVGQAALDFIAQEEAALGTLAQSFKTSNDKVVEKVEQLIVRAQSLEKELQALKAQIAVSAGNDLAANAKTIKGMKVLAARMDGADVDALRTAMDQLKNKLGSALILLASNLDGKVTLLAGVTKDLLGKAKAGDAVKECAPFVDGRGGGKPDLAQAGGQKPEGIDAALAAFEKWAEGL